MPFNPERLADLLDEAIVQSSYLTQGQIGALYRVSTPTRELVVKCSEEQEKLSIEAKMLQDLAQYGVRVPEVVEYSGEMLVMAWVSEVARSSVERECAAADTLVTLHRVSNDARMYGYWYDTTIGPFMQSNEQTQYNWGLFLGQMRIMPMAKICYDQRVIDYAMLQRLERLSRDIYKRIDLSRITPSLLHGDLWRGNILFDHSGAVLIDPAIYFGDREMDLAFIRMFDTFGDAFWERYSAEHPLSDDFETVKRPLYQIYYYLVHIALYGEAYSSGLESCLATLKA